MRGKKKNNVINVQKKLKHIIFAIIARFLCAEIAVKILIYFNEVF